MRKLGRFILGTLFIVGFIGVLVAGSMRLSLLSRSAWKKALAESGMYEQMADGVEGFINKSIKPEEVEKLRQEQASGNLSGAKAEEAKKMLTAVDGLNEFKENLKSGGMEETIEMNIERIFGFLRGKEDDFSLYLPFKELGMPDELLNQLPFDITDGELGVRGFLSQSSGEEAGNKTMESLKQLQTIVGIVGKVYVLGGLMLGLILVGYYFLGKGIVKQVRGVSWLLLVSGALGMGLAEGVGAVIKKMLVNMTQLSEMIQGMIGVMVERLVGSMKLSSGIVLGVGVVGVGVMIYMVKSGKLKAEKEELSDEEKKKKRRRGLIAGVVIVLLLGFLGMRAVSGLKKLTQGPTVDTNIKLVEGMYESEYGWKMKAPAGWGRIGNEASRTDMLAVPEKQAGEDGWSYVAVEPFKRRPEVDQGGFLQYMKGVFLSEEMAKKVGNLSFVKEPVQGEWRGYMSYEYMFDNDYGDKRLRQFRRYVFPKAGGDGWLIYSQSRVDEWPSFEPLIMETINSFEERQGVAEI